MALLYRQWMMVREAVIELDLLVSFVIMGI